MSLLPALFITLALFLQVRLQEKGFLLSIFAFAAFICRTGQYGLCRQIELNIIKMNWRKILQIIAS